MVDFFTIISMNFHKASLSLCAGYFDDSNNLDRNWNWLALVKSISHQQGICLQGRRWNLCQRAACGGGGSALSSVSVGGSGGSGLVAFEALAAELQAAQVGPMEQSNTCHTTLKSAYTQNTISKLVTLKQKVCHVFFPHCHLHPSKCTHLYVLVNIWCVWNVLQQCPLP